MCILLKYRSDRSQETRFGDTGVAKKNHFNNEIIMKGNITGALLTLVSARLMCMMTITRVSSV